MRIVAHAIENSERAMGNFFGKQFTLIRNSLVIATPKDTSWYFDVGELAGVVLANYFRENLFL